MEVIDLDSEEESPGKLETKKKKGSKTCNSACINFQCKSGLEMLCAPIFACSYYGANIEKKKKRQICKECFDGAMKHQQQIVTAFLEGKPLIQCEFPDHSMEVEIFDSDDSDQEKEKISEDHDTSIPEDVLLDIENNFGQTLNSIFVKYDIDYQLKAAKDKLKNEYHKIDAENDAIDKEIKSMMRNLDSLRSSLYEDFKPQIELLEEIEINEDPSTNATSPLVATKKVTQVRMIPNQSVSDSQPEVLSIERINRQEFLDLPPTGRLEKPQPDVDDIVYLMKHPLMPWLKGKVHSVLFKNPFQCRVRLLQKKNISVVKCVSGKQIALATPSSVIIPVGMRVVAIFHDVSSSNYYSGVIAEPPKSTNKYRYLVFFDDGYAQYVTHKDIFLVYETSLRVWEDIPNESRIFVKKYIESYPERPMVKLQTGQVVKTEWNGKWWIARVVQVDASLVQMHFDADGRTEWIYRGSARLGPLYLELLKANARQQGHHVALNTPHRHRLPIVTNKNNLPYVEYTSYNGDIEEDLDILIQNNFYVMENQEPSVNDKQLMSSLETQQQPRAVAKKSTAKKPTGVDNSSFNSMIETKSSHSIVYYQMQNKIQSRKFVAHKCGPECIEGISFTPEDLKGYSPLSIPLLCGWNRQYCKFCKGKKVIYQAPCGVRLRNMEELHNYLRLTGSPMSVDLFEFDHWVHCLAEFVLDKCFVNIKDLSYGVENVAIPCVNEIDHALPDSIRYTTKREPTEGVHLNLDPNFLCSCDCEDDCQDKSKCQCWQLTIQGASFCDSVPSESVGYIYKRLTEPVMTGIYECNSGCKCAVKTCLNRVVQHPLTLKLQVFKTASRGWGIRCLNDIPRGAFICVYAGRLLTEQGANEGGKNYGDEYLAELDYVEVVEGYKEGYESDVLEPEMPLTPVDEDKESKESEEENVFVPSANDSDEDFNISRYVNINVDEKETSSMRKRLRKRKKNEAVAREELAEKSDEENGTKTTEQGKTTENQTIDQDGIILSDDEESRSGRREPSRFDLTVEPAELDRPKFKSVRDSFGKDEAVYIMDAKTAGNIGRYLNHSCDPNVFVQNVFIDTHDIRFPWVAFFAMNYIRAGQELTWNYSYDVGSIPGKVIICKCGASNCRGRLL